MQDLIVYIEKCKTLIEKKLAWGNSASWQNQDFEFLSEKIFESTGIQLSVSTLKRLWGKVRYGNSPNLSTLNALAQFIGYENWRAFMSDDIQTSNENDAIFNVETNIKTSSKTNKIHSTFIWWGAGITLALGIIILMVFYRQDKKLILGNVNFSSKLVTQGLPNTVIFKYDVSNTNADSVFIQQSWDSRLRKKVDITQKEFACTYYSPGYYRAKLIVNDSIVKEHDVFIESQGWTGIIERTPVPVYLPESIINKNDFFDISEADVSEQGIDFSKEIPWVSFTKVDKNIAVPCDNFFMEVELKNTYNKGNGICQNTRIDLLGTINMTGIPLCIKGCVGELDFAKDGSVKDLSLFGVNFNDWVKVRFEAKNSHFKIFINNQLAYEKQAMTDIGSIIGVRINFTGAGEMRRFDMQKI